MTTLHHCAVLGDPIDHSLSPVLHMAAYDVLGLDDWRYERIQVPANGLASLLQNLDASWRGLSLTMPLKRTVGIYGTYRDYWSSALAVANTAILHWDSVDPRTNLPQLDLYNTDVEGIVRALRHAAQESGRVLPRYGRALILGNGNTAASALAACTELSITQVTIAARRPEASEELERLARNHGIDIHVISLSADPQVLLEALIDADITISTIPGAGAQPVADVLDASGEHVHGMLLDVIYGAGFSTLRDAYTRAGGQFVDGREMLLYQAIAQVVLMTGHDGQQARDAENKAWDAATLEAAMRRALYNERSAADTNR